MDGMRGVRMQAPTILLDLRLLEEPFVLGIVHHLLRSGEGSLGPPLACKAEHYEVTEKEYC